jgi:hypothetical protein
MTEPSEPLISACTARLRRKKMSAGLVNLLSRASKRWAEVELRMCDALRTRSDCAAMAKRIPLTKWRKVQRRTWDFMQLFTTGYDGCFGVRLEAGDGRCLRCDASCLVTVQGVVLFRPAISRAGRGWLRDVISRLYIYDT